MPQNKNETEHTVRIIIKDKDGKEVDKKEV